MTPSPLRETRLGLYRGPAPVREGIIDFKRIFDNANVVGMNHFFVEHDMPADPYASITTSYNNLQKIMS